MQLTKSRERRKELKMTGTWQSDDDDDVWNGQTEVKFKGHILEIDVQRKTGDFQDSTIKCFNKKGQLIALERDGGSWTKFIKTEQDWQELSCDRFTDYYSKTPTKEDDFWNPNK